MTKTIEPIKTMKLYSNAERIFNELREIGIGLEDPISVEELLPFDQYHYGGAGAVDHAIEMCEFKTENRILEVGSGIGGPARYIAHKTGCTVTALELQSDLHEVGVQLTKQCNLTQSVQHEQGDFLEMELGTASYDGVVSWLVFLHIPNRQRLFARCMEMLNPGGRLYIEDFSRLGTFSQTEQRDLEKKIYCEYLPTPDEYVDQVATAGFCDIQTADMTASWTHFVRTRLDAFRAARDRNLRVHGDTTVDGLDDFYATMRSLYEGGNLGGLRLVATKPE